MYSFGVLVPDVESRQHLTQSTHFVLVSGGEVWVCKRSPTPGACKGPFCIDTPPRLWLAASDHVIGGVAKPFTIHSELYAGSFKHTFTIHSEQHLKYAAGHNHVTQEQTNILVTQGPRTTKKKNMGVQQCCWHPSRGAPAELQAR